LANLKAIIDSKVSNVTLWSTPPSSLEFQMEGGSTTSLSTGKPMGLDPSPSLSTGIVGKNPKEGNTWLEVDTWRVEVRTNHLRATKCVKKKKGEMLLELEEELVLETMLKYIELASIGKFNGKELVKKTLRGWVSTTWDKMVSYSPKFHLNYRGFIIYLFKIKVGEDRIRVGGPYFN